MSNTDKLSRKLFLKSLGSFVLSGTIGGAVSGCLTACNRLGRTNLTNSTYSTNFPVKMLGPSMAVGHRLRDMLGRLNPAFAAEVKADFCKVVIVGGGIAGLSTGWWLQRHGFNDFTLLELESACGGNSRSGKNKVSAYPWGAHYVPLPNLESHYVRLLFAELGLIEGDSSVAAPRYNELHLCHDPQERLFKDGQFQDGLVPRRGLKPDDSLEIRRFFELVHELRDAVGADGRPAFAIPVDLSSQDPKFRELDEITFAQWLEQRNFHSKPLLWYIDYCCRDDYGALSANISAWAGLHYFAGRRGRAANAETNSVVTFPSGNGYLAQALKEKIRAHIIESAPVLRILPGQKLSRVIYEQDGKTKTLQAETVIFAAPRFLAPYIIADYKLEKKPEYAPWLVANLTLSGVPGSRGTPLAWDNVSYYGDSLGYVVANHQEITTRRSSIVITYYRPLARMPAAQARRFLQAQGETFWRDEIVKDLEIMHPGIGALITSMELWPWGHGMVSPSQGYMWTGRQKLERRFKSVVFAHSDMSGISNFEEAQYQGIMAAETIISSGTALKEST